MSLSLLSILEPQENNWLKTLSHAKDLPDGVRILRFSDGDTLTWDRASGIRETKRRLLEDELAGNPLD